MHNRIAALLTAFGILGLAIAPLQTPSTASLDKAGADQVALAISLGSKLQLVGNNAQQTSSSQKQASRCMICGNIYRISGAAIGVGCRNLPASKTVALVH